MPQASAVVGGLSLSAEERRDCRVMLLDAKHRVIASSDGRGELTDRFPLVTEGRTQGWYQRNGRLVAFALTPGYETYKGLGWYGVIDSAAEGADRSAAPQSDIILPQAVGF
jgi:hypothetical protein